MKEKIINHLFNGICAGNRRSLAQAITLIESKLDKDKVLAQELLEKIIPKTKKSIRIGITGVPGAGKSTFIEAFGLYLISKNKKVAVLAVDPSSPVTGGSILGDKTRMEYLAQNENSFIRPSPSEGSLGGVAHKTREAMLLCETSGYDVILIETVGVGQSEYEVASMVDFFLVLMLPNAGDELQGIKKGILELADAIVVNKVDGDSINMANVTMAHYTNALHLMRPKSFWNPEVLGCSAIENKNIDKVWEMIESFFKKANTTDFLTQKRATQNKDWMWKLVKEMMEIRLKSNPSAQELIPKKESEVEKNQITPYKAATQIISLLDSD